MPAVDSHTVVMARQHILCCLQAVVPAHIEGYENETRTLYDMLLKTATTGQSNSILVIGKRGAGKSLVLEAALNMLREDKLVTTKLHEIHVNGLLQTDDKIALKEITKQLKLEHAVGERVFGSFSENLQFLLQSLKSVDRTARPILFVLDEFDLFAQHRNQTLLYNLFDIAQSKAAPICVVGLTCRLDVIELLEKRVKSRFSHRQMLLSQTFSVDDYLRIAKTYLSLPNTFPNKIYVKKFNANVEELFKETAIIGFLKTKYHLSANIRELQRVLLGEEQEYLTAPLFLSEAEELVTDDREAMLRGLSVLELCLLVSMKNLTELYQGEAFNFEMVYSDYHKFAQRRPIFHFDKDVAFKAYEHLCALELVCRADFTGSKTQKEFRPMVLQVHKSQVLTALENYPSCPTEVKSWGKTSMVPGDSS